MVIEKIVEAVGERKPVVIVFRSQDQVVRLGQNGRNARPKIDAAEIESAEFVVIKFLLLQDERAVKRFAKLRRVSDPGRRREDRVALFAALDERDVRRVINRGGDRDLERFVALDPLQYFLFADVRFV